MMMFENFLNEYVILAYEVNNHMTENKYFKGKK